MSIGSGLCYHFNAYNYSIHYEHVQVQAVIMQPARWRTMRMQPDQYILLQYYTDWDRWNLYAGTGYATSGRMVWSGGVKFDVVPNLSTSLVIYQANMNHIVIGLNLEI